VVEVTQVREFVAQSAHQTGIAQRSSGHGVAKPDLDHAIFVTDAVPALHVGALGLDRPVTEAEPPGDLLRVSVETSDQTSRYVAIFLILATLHARKFSVGSGQRQEGRVDEIRFGSGRLPSRASCIDAWKPATFSIGCAGAVKDSGSCMAADTTSFYSTSSSLASGASVPDSDAPLSHRRRRTTHGGAQSRRQPGTCTAARASNRSPILFRFAFEGPTP